jgi:hypothetical protein
MKNKSRIEITVDIDEKGIPSIDGGLIKGDDYKDPVSLILESLHPLIAEVIEAWVQEIAGDHYIKATGDTPEKIKAGIKLQEDIAKAGRY